MKDPVLFLDVDGVLNRVGATQPNANFETWGDWFKRKFLLLDGSVKVNTKISHLMARALMDLPVEIRWLTTWEEDAPRFLAPVLGLPDYEVAGVMPAHRRPDSGLFMVESSNWKLDVILHTMREDKNRPIIWVDDEANDEDAYEALLDAGHTRVLAVRCRERDGYTPDDHALVEKFIVDLI